MEGFCWTNDNKQELCNFTYIFWENV